MRDLWRILIKKDRLGNLSMNDRGDRIRTCDLVLPKDMVVDDENPQKALISKD